MIAREALADDATNLHNLCLRKGQRNTATA